LVDIAQQVERKYEVPQPAPEPELIGKVPRKTANGPTPRETYERGMVHFDALSAERDRLERDLKEARLKISQLELQISEIENTRATIESRINSCVLSRDDAVREAGELRGALNSVAAICIRYHNAQQD
jgi:septal ring factor EnvC (AmiA/AmiB activator)